MLIKLLIIIHFIYITYAIESSTVCSTVDIDGNAAVDADDLMVLLRVLSDDANESSATIDENSCAGRRRSAQRRRSDINGDGRVDVRDLYTLRAFRRQHSASMTSSVENRIMCDSNRSDERVPTPASACDFAYCEHLDLNADYALNRHDVDRMNDFLKSYKTKPHHQWFVDRLDFRTDATLDDGDVETLKSLIDSDTPCATIDAMNANFDSTALSLVIPSHSVDSQCDEIFRAIDVDSNNLITLVDVDRLASMECVDAEDVRRVYRWMSADRHSSTADVLSRTQCEQLKRAFSSLHCVHNRVHDDDEWNESVVLGVAASLVVLLVVVGAAVGLLCCCARKQHRRRIHSTNSVGMASSGHASMRSSAAHRGSLRSARPRHATVGSDGSIHVRKGGSRGVSRGISRGASAVGSRQISRRPSGAVTPHRTSLGSASPPMLSVPPRTMKRLEGGGGGGGAAGSAASPVSSVGGSTRYRMVPAGDVEVVHEPSSRSSYAIAVNFRE